MLGVHGIGFDDLWYDEYRTMWYAGAAQYGPTTLATTWARVAENAVQTPGYYLILNLWGRATGDTIFANRYLSVLFGVFALAVIYRAGQDIWSNRLGLAAMALLIGSAYFTIYLHEMRTYTLVVLSSTACVWLYWRLINGYLDWPTQAGFVLSVLLLPYSHYYAIMTGLAIATYHLLAIPKNRAWWRVPVLMTLAVLPFIPWVSVFLHGANAIRDDTNRVIFALSPLQLIQQVAEAFSNANNALLVLLIVSAVLFAQQQKRVRPLLVIVVGILVWALAANMWSKSLSQTRYMMMIWGPLSLVVGLGIVWLAQQRVPMVIPLGVWLIWGVWYGIQPAYVFQAHNADWYFSWTDMRNLMQPVEQPGDHLLVQLPRGTGEFGHKPLVEHYLYGSEVSGEVIGYPIGMSEIEYDQLLHATVSGYQRLWVASRPMLSQVADLSRMASVLTDNDYAHCQTYADTPDLQLALYAHIAPNLPIVYTDTLNLQADVLATSADTASGIGTISTVWHTNDESARSAYSYSLRLVDTGGQVVQQADAGVPSTGCELVTLDINNLPAGVYEVEWVLYAWETGERLTGTYGDYQGEILPVDALVIP